MRQPLFLALLLAHGLYACGQSSPTGNQESARTYEIVKPDADWAKALTTEQYRILREKGTEMPFTGKYYLHKEKGTYSCAGCGNELFTHSMKFESNCGWPSFDREIAGGKIIQQTDRSHGMVRTEILCAKCGGHLGHIFDDGPTSTGMRYCVNSLSLNFTPLSKEKKAEKEN